MVELTERKQRLLMALVERHIRDGQPVASRALAESGALKASPATIRNVMAELEDLGVLASPHTSAGRVPTDLGYRLYVDALLRAAPSVASHTQALRHELEQLIPLDQSPKELVQRASRALAELTRMAGLVVVPRRDVATLRQVEFLPLSDRRVLVVLVVNRAEVQNRVIHTDRDYSDTELKQASNYINRTYGGCNLDQICDGLLSTLRADKAQMDALMQTAVDVAAKALTGDEVEGDYVVSGEANLLGLAQADNLDRMRDLFEAFTHKRDILHLLERSKRAEGVQIFIGSEAGHQAFDEVSMVAAPYQVNAMTVGVLAVVGPTRMDYERVIPTVDITARILSATLGKL